MKTKIFYIITFLFLLYGCGQEVHDDYKGFVISSKFLNVTHQIGLDSQLDPSNQFTSIYLYYLSTDDINVRSGENVLFRPPFRPTHIKYGQLDDGVLGVTECEYRSNGTSDCIITLSHVINPETATNEFQRYARAKAFIGVLRHELGHAFGLGHMKDDPSHVMYPYFREEQLENINVEKFIVDLTNFRTNGTKSGLPEISIK